MITFSFFFPSFQPSFAPFPFSQDLPLLRCWLGLVPYAPLLVLSFRTSLKDLPSINSPYSPLQVLPPPSSLLLYYLSSSHNSFCTSLLSCSVCDLALLTHSNSRLLSASPLRAYRMNAKGVVALLLFFLDKCSSIILPSYSNSYHSHPRFMEGGRLSMNTEKLVSSIFLISCYLDLILRNVTSPLTNHYRHEFFINY